MHKPPTDLINAAFNVAHAEHGPPWVCIQTPDGVTWFAIRDYGFRQEGLQLGTGCFFTFQSKNADGTWGDWVMLNGGLISREPGNEQGDLDFPVVIDGKPGGFAIVGNMVKFGGPPPGLVPVNNGQMNLGAEGARMNELFINKIDIPTIGKQININGTWEWWDCIPVNTQQGIRYLPVYRAFGE